jgi:hypothetical protein
MTNEFGDFNPLFEELGAKERRMTKSMANMQKQMLKETFKAYWPIAVGVSLILLTLVSGAVALLVLTVRLL